MARSPAAQSHRDLRVNASGRPPTPAKIIEQSRQRSSAGYTGAPHNGHTTAGEAPVWAWTEPGPLDAPEAAALEGALEVFAAGRAATVARVTGLDEAGWARSGTHATFGRLDVAGLLGVVVDHDDEHLGGLEARAG